jgi:hypothetical protein
MLQCGIYCRVLGPDAGHALSTCLISVMACPKSMRSCLYLSWAFQAKGILSFKHIGHYYMLFESDACIISPCVSDTILGSKFQHIMRYSWCYLSHNIEFNAADWKIMCFAHIIDLSSGCIIDGLSNTRRLTEKNLPAPTLLNIPSQQMYKEVVACNSVTLGQSVVHVI